MTSSLPTHLFSNKKLQHHHLSLTDTVPVGMLRNVIRFPNGTLAAFATERCPVSTEYQPQPIRATDLCRIRKAFLMDTIIFGIISHPANLAGRLITERW